jgi:hypothetical protein
MSTRFKVGDKVLHEGHDMIFEIIGKTSRAWRAVHKIKGGGRFIAIVPFGVESRLTPVPSHIIHES